MDPPVVGPATLVNLNLSATATATATAIVFVIVILTVTASETVTMIGIVVGTGTASAPHIVVGAMTATVAMAALATPSRRTVAAPVDKNVSGVIGRDLVLPIKMLTLKKMPAVVDIETAVAIFTQVVAGLVRVLPVVIGSVPMDIEAGVTANMAALTVTVKSVAAMASVVMFARELLGIRLPKRPKMSVTDAPCLSSNLQAVCARTSWPSSSPKSAL
jgi:hypothetical protein